MKKIALTLVLAAIASVTLAQEQHRYSVGLKLWNVWSDYADDTVMYGPTFSMDLPNDLWLSAMATIGTFDYYEFGSEDERDAEVVLGKSFQLVDIGIGLRYLSSSFKRHRGGDTYNVTGYGPMIYVGVGQPFGESPLGWYGGGSWVPVTWGDLDEAQHFNVEAGIYATWQRWNATLGYRLRQLQEGDVSDYKGIAASLAFHF